MLSIQCLNLNNVMKLRTNKVLFQTKFLYRIDFDVLKYHNYEPFFVFSEQQMHKYKKIHPNIFPFISFLRSFSVQFVKLKTFSLLKFGEISASAFA